MTGRHLIAYGLIALLVAGLAALVWSVRYNSHKRTYARQQDKQRMRSAARASALMSTHDEGGRP